MFAIRGEWIHYTKANEEWWFRYSDIASIETMGEAGKPVGWNEYWFAAIHIKGQNATIPLHRDEFETMKRVIMLVPRS